MRALVVMLAVLGAIAWGLSATSETDGDGTLLVEVLGGKRVFGAERLLIQHDPRQVAVEIERGGDGAFHLAEPLRDRASVAMLENIARVWDSAKMIAKFEGDAVTPEVLTSRELDPPSGRFRIEWSGGKAVDVVLGGRSTTESGMFLLVDGTVYESDMALHSCLVANVSDYRDRFVFRNSLDQLQHLKLRRKRENDTFEELLLRRTGDRFALDGREDLDLNTQSVTNFLGSILGLRVAQFLDGNARAFGPRLPRYVIEVAGSLGTERVDLYVDEAGGVSGWAEPRELVFFCESARLGGALELPLRMLRSQLLFPVDVMEDLTHVTFGKSDGTESVSLKRRAKDLWLVAPVEGRSNPTAVAKFLSGLRKFYVLDFVADDVQDLRPYGLDAGYRVLRVRGAAWGRDFELHIGRRDGDRWFVRRADSRHVVVVSHESIQPMLQPWTDYVSLDVLTIHNPAAVRHIVVSKGAATVHYERDDQGDWRESGGGDVDDAVADAFDVARELAGKDILIRAELGDALSTPQKMRFETRRRDAIHELELHALEDGRVLAATPGSAFLHVIKRGDGGHLLSIAPR